MREKLVAKGVDASTHNFADFPDDVENISSGGDGAALKYLGQMDTRAYVSTDGVSAAASGSYSTFVFELPANMGTDCSMMIAKKQLGNRGRVCFVSSNPLLLPVPTSGTIISGYFHQLMSDNEASNILSSAKILVSTSGIMGTKYLVVTTSNQIGNDAVPYMYLAKR